MLGTGELVLVVLGTGCVGTSKRTFLGVGSVRRGEVEGEGAGEAFASSLSAMSPSLSLSLSLALPNRPNAFRTSVEVILLGFGFVRLRGDSLKLNSSPLSM